MELQEHVDLIRHKFPELVFTSSELHGFDQTHICLEVNASPLFGHLTRIVQFATWLTFSNID